MTKNNEMASERFSEEDWLDRMFRKSESKGTRSCAKTSLVVFDYFCQRQVGLNGKSMPQMIEKYQNWINQDKPDIRSICMSLDKFVSFMGKDHDDILVNTNATFKAKQPKTIKLYFGFIKSYLRICHGIKLSTEDIQDYVQFPKQRKEPRRPISIDILKLLFGICDRERRALYYVLVTSGMRLGEGLSLKKSNFHLDEKPVRVTLLADDTKTKEGRETYITSEALERLKPILEKKKDNEYLFHNAEDIHIAVMREVRYFMRLREKLGLTERYSNSVRSVVNLHSFRAYFHTKASQKHGSDYANALDGHGSYLKQYYREDPKERAKKYLELEPSLLIESVKIEADQANAKLMSDMQDQLVKMQDEIDRLKKYPQMELSSQ